MMNLFALGLLLCSLVSGGFFSPPQQSQSQSQSQKTSDNYVVKEKDRVTVFEFERETLPIQQPPSEPSLLEEKEEPTTTNNNFHQPSDSLTNDHHFHPKELICDAYGKCKHKLASVFGNTKEAASQAADSVNEGGETAMGKVKEVVGKAKDGVEGVAEAAAGKTKQGLENVYETGEMAVEKTKEGLGKAKDSVYESGEMVVDKTKEGLGKAKDSVHETGEMAKEMVPDKMHQIKEKWKEAGLRIGQDLKKGHNSLWDVQTKEGSSNCTSVLQRGKRALNSLGKNAVHPTIGVAHLLALATAYGTTVWVTFVSSHVLAGALPRQQFGVVQSKIYPVYFRTLVGSIGCALGTHALRNPYLGLSSFQTYNMLAALGLVLLNSLWLEPKATRVMFEKMRLEKEEGRGRTSEEEEELVEPLVGPGHVTPPTTLTPAASGGTTIETETVTRRGMRVSGATTETGTETRRGMKLSGAPEEMRSRLEELDKRLKNLNAISSWLNVLTLMSQTWQLVYLGGSMTVV